MKYIWGCLLALISLILNSAIYIAIACFVASWICDINPDKYYSWYYGIWHGLFCIPNWIRSFFDSDVLCKANTYTAWYNFWWWLILIVTILRFFGGGSRDERY